MITGGEGGLGRAMRARLEREGYEVESLDLVNGFDVTDPAAWERVDAVDLAVLNAGVLTGELTIENYRRAVAVNVDGVVLGVLRLRDVMSSGECWSLQPGRDPARFRFATVPGPRRAGETVGLPPIS